MEKPQGHPAIPRLFPELLKTFDYLRLGASADVTNGVAPSRGAPRASRVHRDLRVQPDHDDHGDDGDHEVGVILCWEREKVAPEGAVLVEQLLVREPLHLVLGEHTLGWAGSVRARDVIQ